MIFAFKTQSKRRKTKAQAMVEFALVLPILLMLVYGMIEVGRLIFTYAIVATASREAVRYGSATGVNMAGTTLRYQDCAGITAAAQNVDFFDSFQDAEVDITFHHGPNQAAFASCPPVEVKTGDRIEVEVSADYSPIVPLIPIDPFTITSRSARTILLEIRILSTTTALAPPAANYPAQRTPTPTPSNTPTQTFTPTDTPTPTETSMYSPTPSDTPTPSLTPSITNTPTPITPTYTLSPTSTPTPSATPFPCTIYHSGAIGDGSTANWTVYNQVGSSIKIASITVIWTAPPTNIKLNTVTMNGATIYSGNGNAGITLPGGPWTLVPGANPFNFVWNISAVGISVQVTFVDTYNCGFTLNSSNPSQTLP